LINRVFKKLTGSEFIWDEIRRSPDNSSFLIMVRTEGNKESLPIQKVSQGTLSVISIFGVIYNYLTLRYPQVSRSEVTKQHAIIIIDEIDAHLHPSWQQKLIGLLREEFPNIQFLISAHSPLVVAGCKEGEVSVLRKSANGFITETIVKSLIGVPIADIFQMIFDIEEKDDTYLEILAMLPFKDMMEKRFSELTNKAQKNEKDVAELEELSQQLNKLKYHNQVVTLRNSKDELDDLKNKYAQKELENKKLSIENDQLRESN
jgi:predicted ATP-binding protein involved in virulence